MGKKEKKKKKGRKNKAIHLRIREGLDI